MGQNKAKAGDHSLKISFFQYLLFISLVQRLQTLRLIPSNVGPKASNPPSAMHLGDSL